jgi:HK97 family phage portal protein
MRIGGLRDWAVRMIGGDRYVTKEALPAAIPADSFGGLGFLGRSNLGSRSSQLRAMQGMVAVCVNRISLDLAGLEIKLYKRRGRRRADWLEVEAHPLLDLMERPNPLFTGPDLVQLTQTHLELTGMGFWLILENRLGRPAQVWPLYPHLLTRIETGRDSDQVIKAFWFRSDSGQEVRLDPAQVLYQRYPHPENLVYGASTIQQQAFAFDINLAFKVYHRKLLQNQARPDTVLSSDQHLTKEDADRAKTAWRSAFGGPDQAGGVVVLGAGLKAEPFSINARDGEFMNLAGWTQDEILAAFGVPAGKLGLVKDVNRANMLEIDTTYHRECLSPRARRLASALTNLAVRYDLNLWCEPEHEVPKDREFEHTQQKDRLDRGVLTINEVRADEGLEPVPGGDQPRIPANMMPLAEARLTRGDQGGGQQLSHAAPVTKGQAEDDAAWADFAARVLPWERQMKHRLAAVFQRQALAVAARLREAWPRLEGRLAGWSRTKIKATLKAGTPEMELILADWSQWGDALNRDAWQRVMPAVLQEAGQDALGAFGFAISFNLRDQAVVDWLDSCAATAAKVNDYTREKIRTHLVEATERGETFD